MPRSLTAANAVIFLGVTGLFPVPQQLQGFAADDIFDVEAVTPAETVMGVDGVFSAGWTPRTTKFGITLQADSESNDMFETWLAQQDALKEVFFASGTVLLTSTGRKYAMTKGVLSNIVQMPSAKKILQPRKYVVEFQSVTPANI